MYDVSNYFYSSFSFQQNRNTVSFKKVCSFQMARAFEYKNAIRGTL